MHRILATSFAALTLLAGAGCSTYKNQAKSMDDAWVSCQVEVAAREFSKKAAAKGKSDAIVWHLEAGAAQRAATNYTESNRELDAAAALIDDYEMQAKVKIGREAAAIMSNQQNLPYEGRAYDKIMLHTYKALNYLALGEIDKAQPEIIRTYQRQQDAVEENKRRIEKAREEEEQHKQKAAIEKAKADPKFSGQLEEATSDLNGFKFYADYVNPFSVYLDGLFNLYQGGGGSDLERARKSLERVQETTGTNKFIQADLQAVEAALNGQTPGACTYIIFETGLAPSRDQVRIDIPILITKVSYVGAAFPKLAFHRNCVREMTVKAGEVEEKTALVADLDPIVALDFKNEWPVIVTKTVISTVAKAAANYAVNEATRKQDAVVQIFSRLITAGAQAAVNIADTRSWTTLPKEFQVARVPTPADRRLLLSAPGSPPREVLLEDGAVNVVFAKSITAGGPLLVHQFKLK